MDTPSLVMVGAPHFFSSTTLRPFGPRVTRTASASWFMPRSRRAASFLVELDDLGHRGVLRWSQPSAVSAAPVGASASTPWLANFRSRLLTATKPGPWPQPEPPDPSAGAHGHVASRRVEPRSRSWCRVGGPSSPRAVAGHRVTLVERTPRRCPPIPDAISSGTAGGRARRSATPTPCSPGCGNFAAHRYPGRWPTLAAGRHRDPLH